jgi:hypothetical protein
VSRPTDTTDPARPRPPAPQPIAAFPVAPVLAPPITGAPRNRETASVLPSRYLRRPHSCQGTSRHLLVCHPKTLPQAHGRLLGQRSSRGLGAEDYSYFGTDARGSRSGWRLDHDTAARRPNRALRSAATTATGRRGKAGAGPLRMANRGTPAPIVAGPASVVTRARKRIPPGRGHTNSQGAVERHVLCGPVPGRPERLVSTLPIPRYGYDHNTKFGEEPSTASKTY